MVERKRPWELWPTAIFTALYGLSVGWDGFPFLFDAPTFDLHNHRRKPWFLGLDPPDWIIHTGKWVPFIIALGTASAAANGCIAMLTGRARGRWAACAVWFVSFVATYNYFRATRRFDGGIFIPIGVMVVLWLPRTSRFLRPQMNSILAEACQVFGALCIALGSVAYLYSRDEFWDDLRHYDRLGTAAFVGLGAILLVVGFLLGRRVRSFPPQDAH